MRAHRQRPTLGVARDQRHDGIEFEAIEVKRCQCAVQQCRSRNRGRAALRPCHESVARASLQRHAVRDVAVQPRIDQRILAVDRLGQSERQHEKLGAVRPVLNPLGTGRRRAECSRATFGMRHALRGQQRAQGVACEAFRQRPGATLLGPAQEQEPQLRGRGKTVGQPSEHRVAHRAQLVEIVEDQQHGRGRGERHTRTRSVEQRRERHVRAAPYVEGKRDRRVPRLVATQPEFVTRHRPRQSGRREPVDAEVAGCEMQCEIEGERGLAAAGRPGEQHDALRGDDLDGREMIGRPGCGRVGKLTRLLRLAILARFVDQQRQEAVTAREWRQSRAGEAQQDVRGARREIGAAAVEYVLDHWASQNREAIAGSWKRWISIA